MFFTKIQIEGLSQTFERTGYPYFNHLDNEAGAETSLETARAASRGVRHDIAAGGCCSSWKMLLGTNPGRTIAQFYPQEKASTKFHSNIIIERLRDKIDLIVHHKSLVTACQLAGLLRSVVSMGFKHFAQSAVWRQGLCTMIIYLLNSGHSTLPSLLKQCGRCSYGRKV